MIITTILKLIALQILIVSFTPSLFALTTQTDDLRIVDCVITDNAGHDTPAIHVAKLTSIDCKQQKGEFLNQSQIDFSKALSFWNPLASKGVPEAQFKLGEIYESGMGKSPNLSLAKKWYEKSAQNGYKPAQLSLVWMFENGIGVEKNLIKALYWYQKALNLNDTKLDYTNVFTGEMSKVFQLNKSAGLSSEEPIQSLSVVNKKLEKTETALQASTLALQTINQKNIEINSHIKTLSQPIKRNSVLIKKSSIQIPGLSQSENNSESNDAQAQQIKNQSSSKNKDENIFDETDYLPIPADEIKQLERALAKNELTLVKAEIKTKELANDLGKLKKQKAALSQTIAQLVPEDGPKIALRWPEHEIISGVYRSQAVPGSSVNIIGAVYPYKLIEHFSIDGEQQGLDENGLFLKKVTVYNDPVTVELMATDQAGNSKKKLIVIEPNPNWVNSSDTSKQEDLTKIKFGKYYALVIGNSQYDTKLGWESLKTTINDANAVSELLSDKYQFEVTTMIDADHDSILLALEKVRRNLTEEDNLLVYYAGHGYVDPENDQGYWIPVDGSSDSSLKWISNTTITDQIRAMTARNVMVIADSCYSSSLMRSGLVSLRSGLSEKKKIERLMSDIQTVTRLVLSAGGLQPVADSVNHSNHSVFAEAFLSVLNRSDTLIDSDTLATQVGFIVSTNTKKTLRQVPRYAPLARAGHQGGEFYFVPKNWNSSDL